MSHYLSIYVKPKVSSYDNEETIAKKKAVEPLCIACYTGSNNIYQLFRDNGIDCYVGNGDVENTSPLTNDKINLLKEDVSRDIKTVKKKIIVYDKLQRLTNEQVEDLISSQDYLEELEETLKGVEWLGELLSQCDWNGVEVFYNND